MNLVIILVETTQCFDPPKRPSSESQYFVLRDRYQTRFEKLYVDIAVLFRLSCCRST